MKQRSWSERLGRWTFFCGVAAVLLGLGASIAARLDLISKVAGLGGVAVASLIGSIGLTLGLIALVLAFAKSRSVPLRLVAGLALCLALLATVVTPIVRGRGAPMIHDVTTDLDHPPEFQKLALAADNLRGVGSAERWRAIHARAYPDLRPARIAGLPGDVLRDAQRLALARGWTIAAYDPEAGRLEATDSVSLIGFKDDIVLTVRPAASGPATIVSMRSVSRVGLGDLGVNARRIRSFLADLQKESNMPL